MRDVGHLPPLASDKVAGSIDADLLEIEEVLGVRYCDPSQMTAVALRNPVDEDDDRLEYLVSGSAGPDDWLPFCRLVFSRRLAGPCRCGHGQGSDTRVLELDKEFTALAEACDEADAE